ncbi:MAG: hypothetical protein AAGF99_15320, partial [Bacteroidota bacterium]
MKTTIQVLALGCALAAMLFVGEKQGTNRPGQVDDGIAYFGEKQGTNRPGQVDDGIAYFGE